MQQDRIPTGLAVVFGGIAVALAAVAVIAEPGVIALSLVFAASAALIYYHASGLLAARVYRQVQQRATPNRGPGRAGARRGDDGTVRGERGRARSDAGGGRGGFGAGPREDWTPPRDGASAREAAFGGRRRANRGRRAAGDPRGPGRSGNNRSGGGAVAGSDRQSAAAAYRTLGLEPGADDESVRAAYREAVKEVHPDAESGDEEAFKEVTAAYERLTD